MLPHLLGAHGQVEPGWHADGSIVLYWRGVWPWNDESPSLLAAARRGHVDVVQHILHWLRSHPDRANPDQSLMAAVGVGLLAEALELIDGGVDVTAGRLDDLPDVDDTYLTVACDRADATMVAMLLKRGASMVTLENCHSPLVRASTIGGVKHTKWPPLSDTNELERRAEIVALLQAAADERAVAAAVEGTG